MSIHLMKMTVWLFCLLLLSCIKVPKKQLDLAVTVPEVCDAQTCPKFPDCSDTSETGYTCNKYPSCDPWICPFTSKKHPLCEEISTPLDKAMKIAGVGKQPSKG